MADPGICVLCLPDTCTSEVHPVFNPVAPYGYPGVEFCWLGGTAILALEYFGS